MDPQHDRLYVQGRRDQVRVHVREVAPVGAFTNYREPARTWLHAIDGVPALITGVGIPEWCGSAHHEANLCVSIRSSSPFDCGDPQVQPGSTILIADGSLVLKVTKCLAASVMCVVENNQSIGERKNMNLPNVKVDLPVLQAKDINDLQNFAVPHKVDFIAASFVQSAADVHFIRGILGTEGKNIKIISKIENQEVCGRAAASRRLRRVCTLHSDV